MITGDQLSREVLSLFNGPRSTRRLEWVDAVRYVQPDLISAAQLAENQATPNGKRTRLCPQAATAVNKLTSAYLSYITPPGHKWFSYSKWITQEFNTPQDEQRAEDWYNRASDIIFEEVEKSNIYNELFPVFTDVVCTGTSLIYGDMDEETKEFFFKHVPAGTFALDVDHRGRLTRVARKFKMTAMQIVEMFPNSPLPPEITPALADASNAQEEEFELIHYVRPRYGGDDSMEAIDPLSYPYASYYILANGNRVLEESGYPEMPYTAIRFSVRGNQVYGRSPLLNVMDYIEDLRTYDSTTVEAAKRRAIPPVLIPPEMRGQVALGAGQQTVVPRHYQNSALPREWAPSSDTRELIDQRNLSNEYLKDALFVTFLEVISSQSREMTAEEVRARESEKLMAYAQLFTQFVNDWKPMQLRIFSLAARAGMIDVENAPEGVVEYVGDKSYVSLPKVAYIGRMAQALERAQLVNMNTHIARVIELANVSQNADLLMNYDWQKISRAMAIMDGMPARFLLPQHKVEELRQQLLEARNQQMSAQEDLVEAQAAEHAAKAAESVSKIYE